MPDLIDLTLTEALQKLRNREITAVGLTRAYLERIEKYGAELNCYITVTPERALADAAASDARYAAGNPLPLDGIPIGMKDLFCTFGIRTTAGSHILENFIPQYESTVSQKLRDAGTVLLGKLNTGEFGMASTTNTSYFGPVVSPYGRARRLSPGGSSGGSASAVAGGLACAATGTDTGNSTRFPASLTGLVGFKPTYGVCSRFGCTAFTSSLDHPGVFGRTVDDTALMLSVMAGYDENESTSAKQADEIAKQVGLIVGANNYLPLRNIKIGLVREFENLNIDADIKKTFDAQIENLKKLGAEIVDVSVPRVMDVETLYMVISRNEASSNLARYDGMRYGLRVPGVDLGDTYEKTRAAGFSKYVKYRLITGSIMLTHDFYRDCFFQAAKIRRVLDNEFLAAFEKCDFILSPTSPCVSMPYDDKNNDFTPEQFSLGDTLLIGANFSGLPAVSVPMGMSHPACGGGVAGSSATGGALPIGLHIMGRRFDDVRVLQMAKHVEEFTKFDNRPTAVMGE